jgi:hypothetical protein
MTESNPSLTLRPRLSLAALSRFVVLGFLTVSGGCGDDENTGTRNTFEGGVFPGDVAGDLDPMASCPASQPRVGETCPAITETRVTCTYTVGVCVQPNVTYDVTVDFCCVRGGNWDQCGANTTPCDNQEPPETNPDAGAGEDAAADALDAGGDV